MTTTLKTMRDRKGAGGRRWAINLTLGESRRPSGGDERHVTFIIILWDTVTNTLVSASCEVTFMKLGDVRKVRVPL